MLHRLSVTLARRALCVTLWPLTRRERLGQGRAAVWSELLQALFTDWRDVLDSHPGPEKDWREACRLGDLPVPAHRLQDQQARSLWFAGYVQTYLERDLPALKNVHNLSDERRLIRAACLRIGKLLGSASCPHSPGMTGPIRDQNDGGWIAGPTGAHCRS